MHEVRWYLAPPRLTIRCGYRSVSPALCPSIRVLLAWRCDRCQLDDDRRKAWCFTGVSVTTITLTRRRPMGWDGMMVHLSPLCVKHALLPGLVLPSPAINVSLALRGILVQSCLVSGQCGCPSRQRPLVSKVSCRVVSCHSLVLSCLVLFVL